MKVFNHFLLLDSGAQCKLVASPNHGKVINPIYLVLHYTAGSTPEGAIDWFMNPKAQASAHFVLDRDGKIVQMVPMNRRAWHAGDSKWGELSDINSYSVGIEIVNSGRLSKRSDGAWLSWSKHIVPSNEVSIATHKNETSESGWHEYTEQQIDVVVQMGMAIAARYGIVDVLGHDDIAPKRKADPGPLFPMSSVRSRILGREA